MQYQSDQYPGKFVTTLSDEYRARSVNIIDGSFFEVDPTGKSSEPTNIATVKQRLGTGYKVIMVHGTMYDPEGDGLSNPHLTIFEVLRNAFAPFENVSGIGWTSVSFTPGNLFEAWFKGHLTWYGLAVRNAGLVSTPLSQLLSSLEGPYAIVCHSIGCDIARHALRSADTRPERILLINPDTDYAAFQDWSIAQAVPTLHVAAKRDSVLRLSQYARRNSDFHVRPDQSLYAMETIDFDQFLPDAPRDSFRYGNPRRLWDHMASLEVPELWPRYREFLKF